MPTPKLETPPFTSSNKIQLPRGIVIFVLYRERSTSTPILNNKHNRKGKISVEAELITKFCKLNNEHLQSSEAIINGEAYGIK